jgi:hypothetical protein
VAEEVGLLVRVTHLAGIYSKPKHDELFLLFSCKQEENWLLMKRNIEIDRLRAVAIILVLASHALYIFPSGVAHPSWTYGGWVGVELFFVISGFVVCNVLAPKLDIAFRGIEPE